MNFHTYIEFLPWNVEVSQTLSDLSTLGVSSVADKRIGVVGEEIT